MKRALTDPRLFSGIGNAYSDEILHRAKHVAGEADASPDAATRRSDSSTRRERRSSSGPIACARRPATDFRRR